MRFAGFLLFASLVFANDPITHERLYLMKRTGPPAVSPDGKHVAVSVVEPAYDDREQISDVWVVPSDASAKPRRITSTRGPESGLAWSPDGKKLAFTARREGDESAQIYVIDVAGGGEAVRYSSISGGATNPQWSPDGTKLLFSSNFDPIAAERKNRKYRVRTYESFPIRQWDHWLDESMAHLFVMDAQPGAKATDLFAGTKLAAEPGFAGVGGNSGYDFQPVWSPDGQSIVFAATIERHKTAYADSGMHLWQIPASGGEPRQITRGSDSYSRPKFRPDGRALYAAMERGGDGKVYHLDRLVMFSWPNPGERTMVTPQFDRSAGAYGFAPDSSSVYLLAEENGIDRIWKAPAGGGAATAVSTGNQGVYTNLVIPAKSSSTLILANWGSAVNPAEVVRVEGGSHRALTEFASADAAKIDWLPLRHFTFRSKRGKSIHNMIALPPAFDEKKKYPLLVLIHGGPYSQWRDEITLRWNYHLLGAPGYVILMTNYTGSTGFGEAFAQAIQGDPLRGPGDELNEAAAEAIKQFPFIDGSRQCAGGASYGGHLANWLEATTSHYKCLVSHAGLINLESQWGTSDVIYSRELSNGGPVWEQGPVWREQNPIRYAAKFKTPMLLSVGENDFRVPLNQTLENWSVLQRQRVPSRLLVWPDENHWILKAENSRHFYREVHAWLKKYLGG